MKSIDFLYTALAAFALILGSYISILFRRYSRLKDQLRELAKGK